MSRVQLGAGRVIEDRYILEARIGCGGMGEVWRARHLALRSLVAIKFLQGASEPSARARRRFLTEARVTANLRTRHAVRVFDFGVTSDGLPYLVMELLEGETLDRRIATRGRLCVEETSQILREAARALARAHALGIVHRDFKPENIMLVADEEDGEVVKVVDFGIAKLVVDLDHTLNSVAHSLAPRPASEPDLVSGGIGTPHYMAPEQVYDSACVGPAVDVWAFGVVAYECLTGRRPFEDESVGKMLLRVLAAEPPPPASVLAPVPALFDDWLRVACARNPEDRFPDVRTAASALAVALDVKGASEPPSLSRPRPSAVSERVPTLSSFGSSVSPLASTIEDLAPVAPPPPPPAIASPAAPPEPRAASARLARPALGAAILVTVFAAVLATREGRPQPRLAAAGASASVSAPPVASSIATSSRSAPGGGALPDRVVHVPRGGAGGGGGAVSRGGVRGADR